MFKPCFSALLIFSFAMVASQAAPADLDGLLNAEYPSLETLYKHLHTHPELSRRETNTAIRIADELKQAGLEVTTHVGGEGVVGVLRNGDGPVILLRTDLDALPVKEETGVPYASQVRTMDENGNEVSVMHACGHDIHMTAFIGTARVLAKTKDRWHGTIVMIGQPAEERGLGAHGMLQDGLYTRFPKPNYCLALHVATELRPGTLGYVEGNALAGVDSVDLLVRGIGGHGAYPHETKDPIVLAAHIITELQTIVSRETAPIEPAVVTVGSIHGGSKHNIIPNEVKMQLTLRSYSDDVRNHTIEAIKRISRGLALAAGLPEEKMPVLTVLEDHTAPTYNDPELTRRLTKALKQKLGEANVQPKKPVMGGEDFGLYGRTADKIPICIFWLGSFNPPTDGSPLPSLHSSRFAPVPEPTIKTGIKTLTESVFELAGRK